VIDADWFKNWLKYSYVLRTFWNKTVGKIEVLYSTKEAFIVAAEWPKAKRSSGGLFIYSKRDATKLIEKWANYAKRRDSDLLLLTEENLCLAVDACSFFFVWDLSKLNFLDACRRVDIRILDYSEAIKVVEEVTKRSWRFSVKPRKDLHLVLSAWVGNKSVGIAMLNKYNFNIDFGVHVCREYWRKRIGTRLLLEAASLAKDIGGRYLTVVRVLRRLKATSADRAALSFYKANNPAYIFKVYRLAKPT